MAVDWQKVLNPESCAVLCMEMQRGVLDPDGAFSPLVEAVEKAQLVANGQRLLAAARDKSIRVVHCTAAFREDRAGTPINTPLVAAMLKNKAHMLEGTPAIEVIDEWHAASDIESRRYHGVSPFTATDLHSQLLAMRCQTVIVMGVSLNLGVTGLCIEAANLGYRVVVVDDAVAGFPEDYARAVLDNTLTLVAKPLSADTIIEHWISYE